jgi:hypothetical protein
MRDVDRDALLRECHVFAQHIASLAPSDYILSKYVSAHEQGQLDISTDALDVLLLRFAGRGTFSTALADTYARFTRPAGVLRRKLVLLAAILESAAPTFHVFEPPPPSKTGVALARIALSGFRFGLMLAGALLLLGPAHVWVRLRHRTARREAAAASS